VYADQDIDRLEFIRSGRRLGLSPRGTLASRRATPRPHRAAAHARVFCVSFFEYYNHEHRHPGIGLHTAASVHYGAAAEVRTLRQQTLDAANAANPDRFSHRTPTTPKLPTVAWINHPTPQALIHSA
jgi:putative transposase